jgi:hypothetical protein
VKSIRVKQFEIIVSLVEKKKTGEFYAAKIVSREIVTPPIDDS